MTITRSAFGAGLVVSLVLSSAVVMAAEVDGGRIIAADKEPQNWLSHGRTYGEQRFSPLAKITTANVGQLGLAWSHDIASRTARGVEATPIVVDGVMYTTGAWSHVLALDARTGKLLWEFDPQISGAYGAKGCCDVVNRGVAVWAGKVYVGAFEGRLIALDAKTGKKVWETLTVDQSQDYTISGAPRVVKGKVIIGNGGADFGVRGYVSAYDAETGTMAWRFYTVPGNPKDGFESKTVEMIAKTWNGEWWRHGGGGTVWHSMAYDPDLDLLYVGVGNGGPWNYTMRSDGKGDNLFLASIVAIDGRARKVLMQAPKNGFFYVLDRATGEFISGTPYVNVTWANGLDPKSGRPIEKPEARYSAAGKPALVAPARSAATTGSRCPTAPPRDSFTSRLSTAASCTCRPIHNPSSVARECSGTTASMRSRHRCPTTRRSERRSGHRRRAASSRGTRSSGNPSGPRSFRSHGTAGCCRPRVVSSSRATAWAASSPTTPRTARRCGIFTPRRESSRRR